MTHHHHPFFSPDMFGEGKDLTCNIWLYLALGGREVLKLFLAHGIILMDVFNVSEVGL